VNGLMRMVFSVVAVFGLLLGSAGSTRAHYVYSAGDVYRNPTDSICVKGRSETSHGGGGGYYRVDAQVHNCYAFSVRKPGGNIQVGATFFKWTGSSWAVCVEGGWSFNPSTSDFWGMSRDFGTAPPCGPGTYATNGAAYAWHNNQWNGGWIWSGQHVLPS